MTALTVQVTALARRVQTLTDDMGALKGRSLEAGYRTKEPAYFGRLIRRPHVLTSDELVTLLEDAREHGVSSDTEVQELYDADLVVRGRRAIGGTEVYLVMEVSWSVGPYDVERAARRAALLARIGCGGDACGSRGAVDSRSRPSCPATPSMAAHRGARHPP
jgi:hypothetical protein